MADELLSELIQKLTPVEDYRLLPMRRIIEEGTYPETPKDVQEFQEQADTELRQQLARRPVEHMLSPPALVEDLSMHRTVPRNEFEEIPLSPGYNSPYGAAFGLYPNMTGKRDWRARLVGEENPSPRVDQSRLGPEAEWEEGEPLDHPDYNYTPGVGRKRTHGFSVDEVIRRYMNR